MDQRPTTAACGLLRSAQLKLRPHRDASSVKCLSLEGARPKSFFTTDSNAKLEREGKGLFHRESQGSSKRRTGGPGPNVNEQIVTFRKENTLAHLDTVDSGDADKSGDRASRGCLKVSGNRERPESLSYGCRVNWANPSFVSSGDILLVGRELPDWEPRKIFSYELVDWLTGS